MVPVGRGAERLSLRMSIFRPPAISAIPAKQVQNTWPGVQDGTRLATKGTNRKCWIQATMRNALRKTGATGSGDQGTKRGRRDLRLR